MVLLMVLAGPAMFPSEFLLAVPIFRNGSVFFSLRSWSDARGNIVPCQPQCLFSSAVGYERPCGGFLTLNQSIWYKKGQWGSVLRTFFSCYGTPDPGTFQLPSGHFGQLKSRWELPGLANTNKIRETWIASLANGFLKGTTRCCHVSLISLGSPKAAPMDVSGSHVCWGLFAFLQQALSP